jgi:hypothetical protein
VHLTWIKPHGSIYMNDGSITRSTREMRMTETERPYFAKPFARRRSAKPATVSCHEQVVQGILGPRGLELINCPSLSGRVVALVRRAEETQDRIQAEIDDILRDYARSPFLDVRSETEVERKDRESKLAGIQSLYAGNWAAVAKNEIGRSPYFQPSEAPVGSRHTLGEAAC